MLTFAAGLCCADAYQAFLLGAARGQNVPYIMKNISRKSYVYLQHPRHARKPEWGSPRTAYVVNLDAKDIMEVCGSPLWIAYKAATFLAAGRWLVSDKIILHYHTADFNKLQDFNKIIVHQRKIGRASCRERV